MSASTVANPGPALNLARWRPLPNILMGVGGGLALLGALVDSKQFGYSWLLAYMFFLSLCLGGLFLVIVHHLVDASWSVPIRRLCEHLACLAPVLALLFLPIALLAPRIYPWMQLLRAGEMDHALQAKQPLFTLPMFYLVALVCLGAWWFFSYKLRYWSLRQDQTGAAVCTLKMRRFAAVGVFVFAFTLTLAAIMWMKALEYQWFSTMYGVYYFSGSVWVTLATVYLITLVLKRLGPLQHLVRGQQFYFIGSLFFAFTVFYAYIHFSQYFIIWNGNIPEETFWYVLREKGSWWDIGLIIIFGHFLIPFLALLRIDAKLSLPLMIPLCAWAWLMHFCDLSFNIMPTLHREGFVLHWIDLACLAFMAGLLSKVFLNQYRAHPVYPLKDPRLREALGMPMVEEAPATDGAQKAKP